MTKPVSLFLTYSVDGFFYLGGFFVAFTMLGIVLVYHGI